MRRVFCLLLVFVMMSSLCVQAFADGDVLYCRMCGKQIPVDSKVCSYCGEKVVLVTDETQGKTPVSEPKPAGNDADTQAPSAEPAANPDTAAVVAEMMAPPATDVKTALSQANAGPSPVTSVASAPVSSAAFAPAAPAYLNTAALTRQVYVTKSPTSESVPYGGSCSFIAHAANATSVTWYIYSGDGSIVTAASDAPYSVSGLYVNGGNSDTLYLSGIPSWWNGCQVQACFTGEGGPVYSDIARIWTYQPAQGKDTSGWTWWDWFCCYYRNDPYHWDYPWHWYDYWVRYPSCAPGWFRPGPHDFDLRPGQPKPPKPDKTTKEYDWIWDKWYDIDPDAFAKLMGHGTGNGRPGGSTGIPVLDQINDLKPDALNNLHNSDNNDDNSENGGNPGGSTGIPVLDQINDLRPNALNNLQNSNDNDDNSDNGGNPGGSTGVPVLDQINDLGPNALNNLQNSNDNDDNSENGGNPGGSTGIPVLDQINDLRPNALNNLQNNYGNDESESDLPDWDDTPADNYGNDESESDLPDWDDTPADNYGENEDDPNHGNDSGNDVVHSIIPWM